MLTCTFKFLCCLSITLLSCSLVLHSIPYRRLAEFAKVNGLPEAAAALEALVYERKYLPNTAMLHWLAQVPRTFPPIAPGAASNPFYDHLPRSTWRLALA
jgi:hypothetical protein